jgi:hypothetical protein
MRDMHDRICSHAGGERACRMGCDARPRGLPTGFLWAIITLTVLEETVAESRTLLLSKQPISERGLLPVGGLLSLGTRRLFRFGDYRLGNQQKRLISVGRGRTCDIVLNDRYVSDFHAIIERTGEEAYRIVDHESANGLFVLQAGVLDRVASTAFSVGLCVVLGKTSLVAVGDDGRTFLSAVTESEFRREAYRVYGSTLAAGRAIGKSPETIRRAVNRFPPPGDTGGDS